MQGPLSVACQIPSSLATAGKSPSLYSGSSNSHSLWGLVEGMNPREANQESVDERTQGERETREGAASLPPPGTAVNQGMQMPMHLHPQQLNPGMMNGAGMPMYSSMMPVSVPGYAFMQLMQATPMYYPFQQQQQIPNSSMFNCMAPLAGAFGAIPTSILPYNNTIAFQQQISQGFTLNPQAAAFNQMILQQNQGPMNQQGFSDASRLSAISARVDEHAATVTEPETSSSQRVSSASTSATSTGGAAHKVKDDRPKRPLSSYNLFFKEERAKMIAELPGDVPSDALSDASSSQGRKRKKQKPHRKVGFEEMARRIGRAWKNVDPELKPRYQAMAEEEKKRYKAEMDEYLKRKRDGIERSREQLEATVSDETRQRYLASSGSRPVKRKRRDTESSDSA